MELSGTPASRSRRALACMARECPSGPMADVKMGCKCWGSMNFWQALCLHRYRGVNWSLECRPETAPLLQKGHVNASPIWQETIFSENFHHLVLVRTDEIPQVPLPFQAIQTEIDGVLDVRRLSPLLCQSLVAHRRFVKLFFRRKRVLPFFAAGKKEDGLFLMSCFPMSTQRTKAGLLARRFSRRTDTNP